MYESKTGTFERPIKLCDRFEGRLLANDENGLQYDYSYAIKHEKRFHFTSKWNNTKILIGNTKNGRPL